MTPGAPPGPVREASRAARLATIGTIGAAWLVFVVALGLRLFDLGRFSLWLDEVRSLHDSETLRHALLDAYHPPASYVLLWGWRRLFGDDEAVVRMPSALCGAAAVLVVIWLAWRLSRSRAAAIAAGALLATAPAAVGLAREARMYGLLMFAVVLAAVLLDAYAERPTPKRAIAAGLAVGLCTSVHAYGALFCAPTLLAFVIVERLRARSWLLFLPSVGVCLFLALRFAVQSENDDVVSDTVSYATAQVTDGEAGNPIIAAGRLFLYRAWAFELQSPWIVGTLALAVVAAAALVLWRNSSAAPLRRAVALAPLLTPLAVCLLPLKSATRLLSPALPLTVALVVTGAALLPSRTQRALAALVIAAGAALSAPFLVDVYRLELEPWRAVCERVAMQPGAVLISAKHMAAPYQRCAPPGGLTIAYPDGDLSPAAAVAIAVAAPQPTIWLIASHTNRPSGAGVDGDGERAAAHLLAETHALVERAELSPILRVERYVRQPRHAPTPAAGPGAGAP